MELQLKAKPKEIKDKFASLKTRAGVADLLEITEDFLCKILYGIEERKKYKIFEIQKKTSKKREISSPPKNIAILQSKLNSIFKLLYKRKYCVHGFTKKKNIKSNAKKHASKLHLVNIDLEDFFPSIHLWRIRGSLMSKPFTIEYEAANVIAQICCRDDGILPQGGVTSPIISNIICGPLDNALMAFASNNRSFYTRYADDITFSTSSFHLPKNIASVEKNGMVTLGDELISIIDRHKFKINFNKVRYASPILRQDVTGLTVNEFPNIQRSYIRTITGALNAWEKYGYPMAHRKYLRKYQQRYNSGIDLDNVIKGKISFVKMVLGKNSPIFRKLAKRYNKLSSGKISIVSIHELKPYPLRGNPPKSQVWNKWFRRYKDSILLLETKDGNGDISAGTVFCIGDNIFGTAGHNLKYEDVKLYFGDKLKPIDEFTKYDKDSIDVGVIRQTKNRCSKLLSIPTQLRLPEIGEEVAAIGYPTLPHRDSTLVMHVGIVEALPVTFKLTQRLIQVSFHSGGGLSGGCLIDRRGFVVGVMTENIYNMPEYKPPGNAPEEEKLIGKDGFIMGVESNIAYNKVEIEVPSRPYGQAVPIEYLSDIAEDFFTSKKKVAAKNKTSKKKKATKKAVKKKAEKKAIAKKKAVKKTKKVAKKVATKKTTKKKAKKKAAKKKTSKSKKSSKKRDDE
jgi:RNA-directed DNA polymerase